MRIDQTNAGVMVGFSDSPNLSGELNYELLRTLKSKHLEDFGRKFLRGRTIPYKVIPYFHFVRALEKYELSCEIPDFDDMD